MTSWILIMALLAVIGPLVANAMSGAGHSPLPWYAAAMDSTGQAPDPAADREAVVQVYAAPAFAWRGIFATHTWIVVKRSNASDLTRYDVVGWGGGNKVKVNWAGPDAMWYGKRPVLLADRRGDGVDGLIDAIEDAVRSYPWRASYRTWPGPNSNTFTAHVARRVPDLRLDLPANAVGKDFVPLAETFTTAPSGTGWQISLLGLVGLILAREEGVELNLLGLALGIDPLDRALRLPGLGRVRLIR